MSDVSLNSTFAEAIEICHHIPGVSMFSLENHLMCTSKRVFFRFLALLGGQQICQLTLQGFHFGLFN